jgi:glucose-1-phosphate cytidylyltransferase
MKVVILAGGLGTRLMEETEARPKPMVEIGGKPIIWHIMKLYEHYGFNDFILCLGYKAEYIKQYFLNYYLLNSNFTINVNSNKIEYHSSPTEFFNITLVDTGLNTNTAGRIKRVEKYLDNETFMLTYGDGVSDVNLNELLNFHKSHGKIATLTTIQTPGRFGSIEMDSNGIVQNFIEKPQGDGMWINGGYFVLEPEVFKYLSGDQDNIQWEKKPLIEILKDKQLVSYKHFGFWKCMDALRDRIELENLWNSGESKWKVW